MFKLLAFFSLVSITVVAALALANMSGYIEIRAGDYLLHKSFSVFMAAFIVILFIWGILFHLIMRTLAIPQLMVKAAKNNRAKRGHKALSDGLIAVASDDFEEARKQARLAAKFLEDPASSLLLTAQSAQLNGDTQAAARYFEAMLDDPSTRFLGLRGLIVQSLRTGDTERTLGLLIEAKTIKPRAPWVLDLEYQLRLERGELRDAQNVAKSLRRLPGVDKSDSDMKLAVTLLAQAVDNERAEKRSEALDKAKQAAKLAPTFFAAHSMVAQLSIQANNKKQASSALIKAWQLHPSGDIASRMLEAKSVGVGDFEAKLSVAQQLFKEQPDHWAGMAVTVEALIDAGKGREAQEMINSWDNIDFEPEITALKMRLDAGGGWLESGEPDRSLTFDLSAGFFACTNCGTRSEQWHSHCNQCGSSSTIRYQSRVSASSERPLTLFPVPRILKLSA